MEDYTPYSTEVEETPAERRHYLRGRFFESWQKFRRKGETQNQTDEDEEQAAESRLAKKSSQKSTEKAEHKWKPERLRDRLRNIFKGWVTVEALPAEVNETTNIGGLQDEQENTVENNPLTEAEPEASVPEKEEGVLAVSVNAQHRYYGYREQTRADAETEDSQTQTPDTEVIELSHAHEPDLAYVAANQPTTAENYQPSRGNQSENSEEFYRRQKANRLERRVKKLRRRSWNMKHEQADMKDRQNKFEEKLDANQKAQQKFENVIVPKMEADRKKLHQRLEEEPPLVKYEIPEAKDRIVEKSEQKIELKTETVSHANAEQVIIEKPVQVEVKPPVEALQPDTEVDDGYRETYYERRHEVKDAPGILPVPVSSSFTSSDQNYTTSPPVNFQRPVYQPTIPTSASRLGNLYDRLSLQPGESMYRQAAVNGAAGGVIILVLLAILMLIR